MPGLFIDYFIEFLVRTSIRLVRGIRSRTWPDGDGTVLSAEQKQSPTWCPLVTIRYEYVVNGAKYGSSQTRAFLLAGTAAQYASAFEKGAPAKVRVNPEDASISVLKDPWRY